MSFIHKQLLIEALRFALVGAVANSTALRTLLAAARCDAG